MRRALILVLMAIGLAGPALGVTCTVATLGVAFGIYSPFTSTPLDTTGTITVTCITLVSTSETYTVKLSTGGAGSYTRYMAFLTSHLNYNLYTDSAHTTIWGDGTGATSFQSFSGTLGVGTTITNYTVYARIGISQAVTPGVYADTLTVTVNY